MEKNEFRLGNLIKVPQDVGFFTCKIVSLEQLGCRVNLKNEDKFLFYDEIEPRPLTEEWMIKFGFTHEGNQNWWSLPEGNPYRAHHVMLMANGFGWFIELEDGENHKMVLGGEYVHGLQNACFVLTNKELN